MTAPHVRAGLLTAFKNAGRTDSLLFLTLVLVELATAVYLTVTCRIPRSHDGLQYFSLQYYFLNDRIFSGEPPQWMPYMSQGTIGSWWYALQGGLLQNVLLLTADWWGGVHFVPLFYAGMMLDELVLTVGVWLLGRRYYESPWTRFFVTATVIGSCVWTYQVWWALHFYYAVPLILELLHRFLDSGRWRFAALAGNLLALQTVGNLPYFLPVTTLVIFAYLVCDLVWRREGWRALPTALREVVPLGVAIAATGAAFACAYAIQKVGTGEIAHYGPGRNVDASVPLDGFLSYAGTEHSFSRWFEMIHGVSPSLDFTFYIGMLCVPLIFLGATYRPRERYLALASLTIFLLVTTGTSLAAVVYYAWPLMKYFRHLAGACCFLKLFLIFLAGFGFEIVFVRAALGRTLVQAAALFLVLVGLYDFLLASDYDWAVNWIASTLNLSLYYSLDPLSPEHLSPRLWLSGVFALAGAGLFRLLLSGNGRWRTGLVVAAVLIQFGDLYHHRTLLILGRTVPLDSEACALLSFEPMPYAARRVRPAGVGDLQAYRANPRVALVPDLANKIGAKYWSAASFIYLDEPGSTFRIDHWLIPLDRLMRSYWKQPINDRQIRPAGLRFEVANLDLAFPLEHPAAAKVVGCSADKIQFFRQAHELASEEAIATALTHPRFRGDALFLSPTNGSVPASEPPPPELDERLEVPYSVRRFSANRLEVDVKVPPPAPVWLMYSDVWHPLWTVTVDGEPRLLRVGDLAYKAVEVPPGRHTVCFHFYSPLMDGLIHLFGVASLFWIGYVVVLVGFILAGPSRAGSP